MQLRSDFRAKLYPNGEMSMGWQSPKRFEQPFSVDKNLGRYGDTWWAGNEALRRFAEREVIREEASRELDSSQAANSHRRGLRGITPYGQRLVRNAAFLLQKKHGRSVLSFLTLTVPPLEYDVEVLLASRWNQVVRVFGQRLKRKLVSRGLPGNYVGVTEFQEKRFRAGRGVGLHLHLCFQGRPSRHSAWVLTPFEIRSMWCEVLSTVSGVSVWSDSCENIKGVRKSAEGYLGKYMSKGVSIIEEVRAEYGDEVIPSSWYMLTSDLRRAVLTRVRTGWDRELGVMDRLPELCASGVISRVFLKFLEIDGREFLIGVSFKIDYDKIRLCHTELREFILSEGKNGSEYG